MGLVKGTFKETPTSGLPTAAPAVGAGSSAAAAAGSSAAAAADVNTTPAKGQSHLVPQTHPEGPPAAVTPAPKVTDHPHDDPSPTSDQPATKQKTGANTAAAKPRASTAAAAAAAPTAVGRLPTCSQADPALHSAADWQHGSNGSIKDLMKDNGVGAVLEVGKACSTGMDSLVAAGLLHQVGYTEQKLSDSKIVYKALYQVNYEGQDLTAQQWKQQEDELPTLVPSSAAAADKEAFESGRAHPAVRVQVNFLQADPGKHWYVRGNTGVGVALPPDYYKAVTGHDLKIPSNDCFRALFNINAVVMLLWLTEGKQQHPELQHIAEEYKLFPKKKLAKQQRPKPRLPEPQEATMSSAAAIADAMQGLKGLPCAIRTPKH